ncbi:sigma-54 interaction domain-containing protein [Halothiobacillus sp. DCM-1]|uniref:sigma-54 interaction domain-containing protein n=1 Tax=Halothiobacillus sp. DCM-1 TaxID=3112558 RepID=UPI00325463CA
MTLPEMAPDLEAPCRLLICRSGRETDTELQSFLNELRQASPVKIDWALVGDAISAQFRLSSYPHDLLVFFVEYAGSVDSFLALWNMARRSQPEMLAVACANPSEGGAVRALYRAGVTEVLLASDPMAARQERWAEIFRLLQHRRRLALMRVNATHLMQDTLAPVASSQVMQRTLQLLHQVAPTPLPVLIEGETGTGKSVLARYLHMKSSRAGATFLTINCGALTPSLLESELFGHEKGAFTGAQSRRIGLLEAADGGTLFLDEINSAPMDLQVRLLHFIQEKQFLRVGGNQPIAVDVRLIFATNKPLADLVAAGSFREDLYYRINVFPLEVPPLRARVDDIPQIAGQALMRACGQLGIEPKACGPGVLEAVRRYPWPGNLRQLDNVIQRSLIVAQGDRIELDDLPPQVLQPTRVEATAQAGGSVFPWPVDASLMQVEQYWIEQVLRQHGGNRAAAARQLGIDPSTLWRRLKKA